MPGISTATLRSRVILVEDGQVALIKRVRDGRTYYIFPGGAVEEGETPVRAAIREVYEELGVDVRLGRLVATQRHEGHEHQFYVATLAGGEFGTGCGPEYSEDRGPNDTMYLPMWVPITELASYNVRPPSLAKALLTGEIEHWNAHRLEVESVKAIAHKIAIFFLFGFGILIGAYFLMVGLALILGYPRDYVSWLLFGAGGSIITASILWLAKLFLGRKRSDSLDGGDIERWPPEPKPPEV